MRISVRIKPNSRHKQGVFEIDNQLIVFVKSPAVEGKANAEALAILSKYLDVAKSEIKLVRGQKSKIKIFEY